MGNVQHSYLKSYVSAFLRSCKQTHCDCVGAITCGFEHDPCGYYNPPGWPEGVKCPRTRQEWRCYCPKVLTLAERFIIQLIADFNGEIYQFNATMGEVAGLSERQVRRIIRSLERRKIVQSKTCKEANCDDHHKARHTCLLMQLPGMQPYAEIERRFQEVAQKGRK